MSNHPDVCKICDTDEQVDHTTLLCYRCSTTILYHLQLPIEKRVYMSISFLDIPLSVAEKIKLRVLQAMPEGTSVNIHFDTPITDEDE